MAGGQLGKHIRNGGEQSMYIYMILYGLMTNTITGYDLYL